MDDANEAEPTVAEMFRAIASRLHSAALAHDWDAIARIRVTCDETGSHFEQRVKRTDDPLPKDATLEDLARDFIDENESAEWCSSGGARKLLTSLLARVDENASKRERGIAQIQAQQSANPRDQWWWQNRLIEKLLGDALRGVLRTEVPIRGPNEARPDFVGHGCFDHDEASPPMSECAECMVAKCSYPREDGWLLCSFHIDRFKLRSRPDKAKSECIFEGCPDDHAGEYPLCPTHLGTLIDLMNHEKWEDVTRAYLGGQRGVLREIAEGLGMAVDPDPSVVPQIRAVIAFAKAHRSETALLPKAANTIEYLLRVVDHELPPPTHPDDPAELQGRAYLNDAIAEARSLVRALREKGTGSHDPRL